MNPVIRDVNFHQIFQFTHIRQIPRDQLISFKQDHFELVKTFQVLENPLKLLIFKSELLQSWWHQ